MKIAIGSDHVGFPLKRSVSEYLVLHGYEIVDVGPDNSEKPVDYPDYAFGVVNKVISEGCDFGVLCCGTGLGMSIAANRMPGIRAALCDDAFSARLSRAHNNANVLCMGANVVTPARAEWIVQEWLDTPFDYGRHVPRLVKLDQPIQIHPTISQRKSPPSLSWDNFSVAMSPLQTVFGPVLFAGRLAEGMQAVARLGFCKIELSLRDPAAYASNELPDLLAKNGLKVSAIATGQSCLHDNYCLCSPDPELTLRCVERLKAFMQIGAKLGANVIIGGVRGRLTGTQKEMAQQRGRAISAIRDCVHYGRELGVPVVLECINRYETNFICSINDGLAALEEIGEPDLKLLVDTFHMNIEEADMSLSVRKAAAKIGYVHFSDSNRLAPGLGHINFSDLLDTLDSIGYQGMIAAEILPLPDDTKALQSVATYFHSLSHTSVEKVTQGAC